MKREYYLRPPEITGEKLLETFLLFQDDKDIPVSQNDVNNFFLDNIPDGSLWDDDVYQMLNGKGDSDESEEEPPVLNDKLNRLDLEVILTLLNGVEYDGALQGISVIPEAGETKNVDDTLITLPRIYLRIIE